MPARNKRPLRIVITAGPTREPIDPVRYLSNYSTGFMGYCLAAEAARRGHRARLISGPVDIAPPRGIGVTKIETAADLQRALRRAAPRADVIVMAAAVADFRPANVLRRKVARRGRLTLALEATPDIIGTLPRRAGQVVAGFALETSAARSRAAQKLRAKRLDLIVGQAVRPSASPFGRRPLDAFLLRASGPAQRLGVVSKPRLAKAILDEIEQLWYGDVRTGETR